MKNFILILSIIATIGLKAQDDVYFVETDTLDYRLEISKERIRGIAYPPLYTIAEYKAIHHQFYYTSRMQPYYIPFIYLSTNSYYNSALYEPIYTEDRRELPNYPSYIDRIIFPVTKGSPRTSGNLPNKHSTHSNQAKENTAGRKF
jgi:hypothetical protein